MSVLVGPSGGSAPGESALSSAVVCDCNFQGPETASSLLSVLPSDRVGAAAELSAATSLGSGLGSPDGVLIRVYLDGGGTAYTLGMRRSFSVPVYAIPLGTHTLDVTAQAPGETESNRATSNSFTVTTPAPVITFPAADAAMNGATSTTVSGTYGRLVTGTTIRVYRNGIPVSTATINADGTWTVSTPLG